MKLTLLPCLLALLAVALSPQDLRAAEASPHAKPMAVAALILPNIGNMPQKAAPMSPLVQPASPYCRRDCDRCRRHCYTAYRVYCHGHHCRGQFTLCMRHCWQDICRHC